MLMKSLKWIYVLSKLVDPIVHFAFNINDLLMTLFLIGCCL
jgi:hypothetical protein